MINLGWGSFSNGRLPASALKDVTGNGDYLEASAGQQWINMRNACYAATGRWINVAPGSSAYRDFNQQEYFWDQYRNHGGNVAAVPGTSNHGWGRAVDLTGYESSPVVWNWLLTNASRFGYSWATGQASGERWHWESLNAPGSIAFAGGNATPIVEPQKEDEDDEMSNLILIRREANNAAYSIIPGQMIKHIANTREETLIKYALRNKQEFSAFSDADLSVTLWNLGFPEFTGHVDKLPVGGKYYWRPAYTAAPSFPNGNPGNVNTPYA